jgi:hypothetical protein
MARQAKTAKPKKKKARRTSAPRRSLRGGRRRFARRLRALLLARPLEIAEMAAALEVEEGVVLVGLRDLRKKRRGQLSSGVVDGRNCWWWVPAAPGDDQTRTETPPAIDPSGP